MKLIENFVKKCLDYLQKKRVKCSTLIIHRPENPNDEFFFCLDYMDYEKEYEITFDSEKYLILKSYTNHLVFTRINRGRN